MATIKDIAKLAGVSQGTASNVLNKRGNVSSKKIILVQNAAKELNYLINSGAQLLRAGKNKRVALVLPNIEDKKYLDFYLSCKSYILSKLYSLDLFLTNDNAEEEKKIIDSIQSSMHCGIITFTSLYSNANKYYLAKKYSEEEVLFVERNGANSNNFLGFDFYNFLVNYINEYKEEEYLVYFIVDDNSGIQESPIKKMLEKESGNLKIKLVTLSYLFRNIQLLQVFDENLPQIIFSENENIDFACKKLIEDEYINPNCKFFSFTSLTTSYKGLSNTIEMNYRMLGKTSAKTIISTISNEEKIEKKYFEIQLVKDYIFNKEKADNIELNVLLLDSPPAYVISHFLKTYSKKTGIKINTDIVSHHDIYDLYDHLDESSNYDLLRVGAEVFSWYAPKILKPFNSIEDDVVDIFDNIIPGLLDSFSYVKGIPYAIPLSPSIQFFFYRKDLFDNIIYQRVFKEQYKEELEVPKTFEQYFKIASFFTQSINPLSPTKYGTTLTLGSKENAVAGSEFMTRYFSYNDSLFKDNELCLSDVGTRKSLENILQLKKCINAPRNWWTEPAIDINNGDIAMTILYSNFASDFYSKNSKIVNKLGFGIVPGGNPLLGGGSLGISKYSKHPKESLELIKWLCSEPIAGALAYYCGTPITKTSLDNYEIIDSYPWLSLFQRQLGNLSYKKISDFDYFNDNEFMNLLGRGVLKYYNNDANIDDTINSIYKEYENRQKEYVKKY